MDCIAQIENNQTYILKCAQNRSRTCTPLRELVPETSASTNFAIWANQVIKTLTKRFFVKMCPEQESNLHDRKVTWPSTMRVYQFRHLGIKSAAKV